LPRAADGASSSREVLPFWQNLRRAQALTGSVSWRAVRFPEIAGLFRFIWRHAGPRASPPC
jgi:hypothetical protein